MTKLDRIDAKYLDAYKLIYNHGYCRNSTSILPKIRQYVVSWRGSRGINQ